jgi:mono/diheme cytochrome c family protein
MKTLLKWLGILLTAVVCIVLIGGALIYSSARRQFNHRYDVGSSWVNVPHDSASIAHGAHIAHAIAKCGDCHGENLGGGMMIDDPALGRVAAPNITSGRGGRLNDYTDQELARVIQHGVKRDGRPVFIMASEAFIYMSDEDLGAVIAYLHTVPPVDTTWPPIHLGPLGNVLIGTGALSAFPASYVDHSRAHVPAMPARDTTAEYGQYLANIGGCTGCHNPSLSGGKIRNGDPKSPPASNLTPTGLSSYQEADFVRVLREGKGPGGRVIDGNYMPWRNSGRMTDAEIHAVWLFLKSLPPKEMGQR